MLPWELRALHRDPGKYHSTSSSVQGHIYHLNAMACLELRNLPVIRCFAKARRIGWNRYRPPLSCSSARAVSCGLSPQNLILNGVVSYFLTLQSINTEGKNKQAMSKIRESPIYKTRLICTAGIPSVLPSTVAISQAQALHFSERLSRDGISASLMPFTSIQQGLLSGTYVQEPQRPNKRVSLRLPSRHIPTCMTSDYWLRWVKKEAGGYQPIAKRGRA